jgi:hypothetical protein
MHKEAMQWLEHMKGKLGDSFGNVLEIGSYNHNGSARTVLEEHAQSWTGIDIIAGPCVDYVVDITDEDAREDFQSSLDNPWFDTVISTEVLEHVDAKKMVQAMLEMVDPDFGSKQFIITCANSKRAPHSADGGALKPNEHYKGIDVSELITIFHESLQEDHCFNNCTVSYEVFHNPLSHDTYAHIVVGQNEELRKYLAYMMQPYN